MPQAICALAMTGGLQGVSARLGGGVGAPRPTEGKRKFICYRAGGVEPRPYGGQQGVRKKNPPVTASSCQPPLGKGAWGRGMRIATAGVRTGLAMTVLFFMEAVLRTVFAGVAGGGATGRKLLA